MATLKLTIFKAKVLKDGSHKVRIAVCHKQETCYIVTQFIIDNLSQFKNGQVVKRPDAAIINTKLRNLLNKYQEKLGRYTLVCDHLSWMAIAGIELSGKTAVDAQKKVNDNKNENVVRIAKEEFIDYKDKYRSSKTAKAKENATIKATKKT